MWGPRSYDLERSRHTGSHSRVWNVKDWPKVTELPATGQEGNWSSPPLPWIPVSMKLNILPCSLFFLKLIAQLKKHHRVFQQSLPIQFWGRPSRQLGMNLELERQVSVCSQCGLFSAGTSQSPSGDGIVCHTHV